MKLKLKEIEIESLTIIWENYKYAVLQKCSILSINNRAICTRMIKKKPEVVRYSKFHVNVCYNVQFLHNELTLTMVWSHASRDILPESTLALIRLFSGKSETTHIKQVIPYVIFKRKCFPRNICWKVLQNSE